MCLFCGVLCRIFGTAIAISAFLNLMIPGACRVHFALVMFVRILQGLVEVSSYFHTRILSLPLCLSVCLSVSVWRLFCSFLHLWTLWKTSHLVKQEYRPVSYSGFRKGEQAEMPKASRVRRRRRQGGRVWGGGVPFPTADRVWGWGCAPPQKILKFYSLKWYNLVHFYTL